MATRCPSPNRCRLCFHVLLWIGTTLNRKATSMPHSAAKSCSCVSFHANKSFQVYSGSALLHACLMRGRSDVLQSLYTNHGFDYFGNSSLPAPAAFPTCSSRWPRSFPELTGATSSQRDLYRGQLLQLLMEEQHQQSYEFWDRYPLDSVDAIPHAIFANVSFPPEIRTPQLPNLMSHPPFQDEMLLSLFGRVHERTKAARRMRVPAAQSSRSLLFDPGPLHAGHFLLPARQEAERSSAHDRWLQLN